jgi:phosphopentomutase
VAAHEDVISLDDLHIACRILREEILVGDHAVARVIARPFVGEPGSFRRTANRRDYSLPPPRETLLDRLEGAAVPRVGVGKVDDLFAHRGITSRHAATNAETYRLLIEALDQMEWGFLFANVVEFDQSWGHRNDVAGFYQGLRELDAAMPELVSRLRGDDILVLTADHGNDPTTPSTDHSREAVPVLVTGPGVRPVSLGTRRTFADLGRTAAEYFGVSVEVGTSFLGEIGA